MVLLFFIKNQVYYIAATEEPWLSEHHSTIFRRSDSITGIALPLECFVLLLNYLWSCTTLLMLSRRPRLEVFHPHLSLQGFTHLLARRFPEFMNYISGYKLTGNPTLRNGLILPVHMATNTDDYPVFAWQGPSH